MTNDNSDLGEPDPFWRDVEALVARAVVALPTEGELAACFERRKVLARRLMDAVKRRDKAIVAQDAQAWLESEMKLAGLALEYGPFVREREQGMASLTMARGGHG
jgi:hypothetical protein